MDHGKLKNVSFESGSSNELLQQKLMGNLEIVRILKYLPGIIIGLTVHEYCHALMAHWCGDNTSRDQGRVTLNPLKHIDPFGFIMLLIAGFGWAKPVQFNEQNLRNPKTDVLKIAFAGPMANAITAMLLSVIFIVYRHFSPDFDSYSRRFIFDLIFYAIYINWGLFVFNLLPIPPLDGSHLLFYPLRRFPVIYNVLYKYGTLVLFGILIISSISKSNFIPILPLIQFLAEGFLHLIGSG
jgi:Zn-dependent protease